MPITKLSMLRIIGLYMIFILSLANAADYYVDFDDPNAEDNNGIDNGTLSKPFKTLGYALDKNFRPGDGLPLEHFLKPGDTLHVRAATYTNPSYVSRIATDPLPNIWRDDEVARVRALHGTAENYIIITAYDVDGPEGPLPREKPLLKSDGDYGFHVDSCSFIKIIGLELEGEVNNIDIHDAWDHQFVFLEDKEDQASVSSRVDLNEVLLHYNQENDPNITSLHELNPFNAANHDDPLSRLTATAQYMESVGMNLQDALEDEGGNVILEPYFQQELNTEFPNNARPDYFGTTGLLIQKSHHIEVIENEVHHFPGTGLRVQTSNRFKIIGNKVHNNSRRGAIGNHGLVVHSTTSSNTDELILDTPEGVNETGVKNYIEQNHVYDNYNEVFSWSSIKTFITPDLDEGKGISMQKNYFDNGWEKGRILIQNNLTHGNGFSGVHLNQGDRMDIINNTSFNDNATGRGSNVGISLQTANDITIWNNIVVSINDFDGFAYAADNNTRDADDPEMAGGEENSVIGGNNIAVGLNPTNNKFDALGVELETITLNSLTDPIPHLKDPENGDFSLLENSSARDNGNTSLAPSFDFNNQYRDMYPDIGALEFSNITQDYLAEVFEAGLAGADSLPEAMPYGDGVTNLEKFAYNLPLDSYAKRQKVSEDQSVGFPDVKLTTDLDGEKMRFTYIRRQVSGLTYTPEKSSTLHLGSWDTFSVEPEIETIDSIWERVTLEESLSDSAPVRSMFIRMRLELE